MSQHACRRTARHLIPALTLVAACGTPANSAHGTDSTILQPSPPISVVTDFKGDVPCYSVVEEFGSVVVPKVCPVVDLPSDVWFVASKPWGDGAVTLVYVAPGLEVASTQLFSRDSRVGWTAFVTGSDGIARFSVRSDDRVVDCAVTGLSVKCG